MTEKFTLNGIKKMCNGLRQMRVKYSRISVWQYCGVFLVAFPLFFAVNASAPVHHIDTTETNSASPKFYLYKPDPNIKVEENRFKAGLLFDVENKKIVWQKDMGYVYPIASLTKMMVALLTAEDVDAGKLHWDDQVQWTRENIVWANKKKVKSYCQASYSLHDLFKNAMIASNNESAEQIARYIGKGDLDATIQRMNVRAREIGMNSTYYGNPTGLPARSRIYDNSSTPSDLLLLTIEMLKHPEITQVTGMDYAAINSGKSVQLISNHNHLAIDFKGEVDGMKTGYTRRAGFCLVATANKCDHRLVSIVLGARAPITRNDIVKNMFNDYYASIGDDPLAPHCANPEMFATNGSADEDANQPEGEYAYQTKVVFKPCVVKKGERLSTLADRYSCSVAELKNWNHLKKGIIRPGQHIIVRTTVQEKVWITKQDEQPTANEQAIPATQAVTNEPTVAQNMQPVVVPTNDNSSIKEATAEKYIYHTVHRGDTLSKIAHRYKVPSVETLKELNNLSDASTLKLGMKIKVPSGS